MNLDKILAHIYAHLRLVVKTEIQKAFEFYMEQSTNEPSLANEDFLSANQASRYMKIKIGTLYAKVEKGEILAYRIGKRKLIFSKEELKKYITKNKV